MKRFVEIVKDDFVPVDRITNVKILQKEVDGKPVWVVMVFVDFSEWTAEGGSMNSAYTLGEYQNYGGAYRRLKEVLALVEG